MQNIFDAIIVSRLPYAAPAWRGYLSSGAPAWRGYLSSAAPAWRGYFSSAAPAWRGYLSSAEIDCLQSVLDKAKRWKLIYQESMSLICWTNVTEHCLNHPCV